MTTRTPQAPRRLRDVLPVTARVVAAVLLFAAATSLLTAASPRCSDPTLMSPVTLAVAGDSTTAKPHSWLHQLDRSVVDPVGGYAHSGWTSGQVLAKLSPVKAKVLVIMLGINDLHFAESNHIGEILANVNRIAARVRVKKVIVSAVAPSNVTYWPHDGSDSRTAQTALNAALEKDANAHGWDFTDPWARIRASDGGYVAGYSVDRIHPTPAGSAIVAKSMTQSILAVAGKAQCRG